MTDEPAFSNLISALEVAANTYTEAAEMTEALISVLIDKGYVTKEEIDTRIAEQVRKRSEIEREKLRVRGENLHSPEEEY